MESTNLIIIEDIENSKIEETWILMTQDMYYTIMDNININYFLIIFTIGCFSSLFCLNRNNNNYNYKSISEIETTSTTRGTSTTKGTSTSQDTYTIEPIITTEGTSTIQPVKVATLV